MAECLSVGCLRHSFSSNWVLQPVAGVKIQDDLYGHSSSSIEHHILQSSTSRSQFALVKFIERCRHRGEQHCNHRPIPAPQVTEEDSQPALQDQPQPLVLRKFERPEHQPSQDGISHEVPKLPQVRIQRKHEPGTNRAENRRRDAIEKPERMNRGSVVGRFKADNEEPHRDRPPAAGQVTQRRDESSAASFTRHGSSALRA